MLGKVWDTFSTERVVNEVLTASASERSEPPASLIEPLELKAIGELGETLGKTLQLCIDKEARSPRGWGAECRDGARGFGWPGAALVEGRRQSDAHGHRARGSPKGTGSGAPTRVKRVWGGGVRSQAPPL